MCDFDDSPVTEEETREGWANEKREKARWEVESRIGSGGGWDLL